jgi:2-succinyl-5-enolpyruvyl-6-hydroxy-3-cyclohexene-1-carboxylate synthase
VQLNLPLAEPLLPDGSTDWPEPLTGRDGPWTRTVPTDPATASAVPAPRRGERVLFVADLTHRWAAPIADAGHLVISEAGGVAGQHVLAAGIHLLAAPEFLDRARPDRVVVLGRPTLFRQVQALLADPRVVVDVVAHPGGYADAAGSARAVAPGLPGLRELPDEEWSARWRDADAAAGKAVADVVDGLDLAGSPRLARDLVGLLPGRATLVLGSSQPPRDVALACVPRDGLRVVANRGVAGIDGALSTAVGVSLAARAGDGPTVALLGDLTFLHDLTGLLVGPDEPRPDLTVVVSNNEGGAIFGTLEPGEPAHAGAFERVFGTPHGTDIDGLVRAFGHRHLVVGSRAELAAALEEPGGLRVIEVRTSRTDLAQTLSRMAEAVCAVV